MTDEYYIWIDGGKIPVSEDVYYAYKRPAWREFKRRKVRSERERSLDVFLDDGFDIPFEEALVDEIVADKLLLDELYAALDELTDEERSLINALFFKEKSERDVASGIGLSQKAVNKRRHRILEKIKKLMGF